jgi:hypothetical protein
MASQSKQRATIKKHPQYDYPGYMVDDALAEVHFAAPCPNPNLIFSDTVNSALAALEKRMSIYKNTGSWGQYCGPHQKLFENLHLFGEIWAFNQVILLERLRH